MQLGLIGPFAVRALRDEVADYVTAAVEQGLGRPSILQCWFSDMGSYPNGNLLLHVGTGLTTRPTSSRRGALWDGELAQFEIEPMVDATSIRIWLDVQWRTDSGLIALLRQLWRRWPEFWDQLLAFMQGTATGDLQRQLARAASPPIAATHAVFTDEPKLWRLPWSMSRSAELSSGREIIESRLARWLNERFGFAIRIEPCGVATGPHHLQMGPQPEGGSQPLSSEYGERHIPARAWLRKSISSQPGETNYSVIVHITLDTRQVLPPREVARLSLRRLGDAASRLELSMVDIPKHPETVPLYAALIAQEFYAKIIYSAAQCSLLDGDGQIDRESEPPNIQTVSGSGRQASSSASAGHPGRRGGMRPSTFIRHRKQYLAIIPLVENGLTFEDIAQRLGAAMRARRCPRAQ